jgi:type IV secretion system protein VirB2
LSKRTNLATLAAGTLMILATPAVHAQIKKVNDTMEAVQGVLAGVAIAVFTIAIMWAGFKMAFQNARWTEVSNVVIGGILVGGAGGMASWLIG